MKLKKITCALLTVAMLSLGLWTDSAAAQRQRFPGFLGEPAPSVAPISAVRQPVSHSTGAPSTGMPAVNSIHTAPQPYRSFMPNAPVTNVSGPATFQGNIQPGASQFDAYGPPTGQPTMLAPQLGVPPGPIYAPSSGNGNYLIAQCDGTYAAAKRLLQQVRFRYTWLYGSEADDLDINDVELDGTFLFPTFLKDPLLLTPGFAAHFMSGIDPASRVYDAYLDLGWQPVITQWLKADLGIRGGIYSDFEKFHSKSIRLMGRGYAVWSHSSTMEFKAGVLYLDRIDYGLLPAGGFIWTPDGPTGNRRWEVLFPNPKLAQRLAPFGEWDVWWYVAGEVGGGSWTINSGAPGANTPLTFDYNDYRVMLGLEWTTLSQVKGLLEVGYAFERKLVFDTGVTTSIGSTFMLRAGLIY